MYGVMLYTFPGKRKVCSHYILLHTSSDLAPCIVSNTTIIVNTQFIRTRYSIVVTTLYTTLHVAYLEWLSTRHQVSYAVQVLPQ